MQSYERKSRDEEDGGDSGVNMGGSKVTESISQEAAPGNYIDRGRSIRPTN